MDAGFVDAERYRAGTPTPTPTPNCEEDADVDVDPAPRTWNPEAPRKEDSESSDPPPSLALIDAALVPCPATDELYDDLSAW